MGEEPMLDHATVLKLFQELGAIQANQATTLEELKSFKQDYMTRQEALSRFREVRAATTVSFIAFLMTGLELWHWLTTK